jgi:NitT/TauT family transport system substrate-binding protein
VVRNKLHIPALVLATSLTLLGAGCGSGGSSATGVSVLAKVGNLEKTTLNVAVLPAVDSAGFFVALHEGLFAREGLTVNYSPAPGDEVIAEQVKGQYDITGANYVSYIEAQLHHQADLRIVAEGSLLEQGSQVIMTMPNSRIQSLEGLKGHVLGVNADANVGFLLVASVLTQNGIAMSTRSSATSVMFPRTQIPFLEMGQALVSGHVAAAIIPEPLASQMEEKYGAVPIADLDVGATQQFPVEGYAVTKAWGKAHPNTLKAFLTALRAGQQIADTDRAAVEAAFESLQADQGHVDKVTASMMALNTYPLGIDATRLQRVADVMQQFGLLEQYFNIRVLLN